MVVWKNFENKCCEYLNNTFKGLANFRINGGSDSTKPDIEVETLDNKKFYIEVKHCPAQCGQFVLLPDEENKNFIYSSFNITEENTYSKEIIEYMNKNFDYFNKSGTSGEKIQLDKKIFENWIINYYKNKGAKYFIVNDFHIFPIEQVGEYLDIKAKYRAKRSGSGKVGKKHVEEIEQYLKGYNYEVEIDNGKMYVITDENIDKKKFTINEINYMFSSRENAKYEIRKLSKTCNSNVIFSIKIKNKNGLENKTFKDFLVNLDVNI